MTNRLRYPAMFTAAYLTVWAILMLNPSESPWIDRVIVGGIALCAAFAVIVMSIATRHWTVRGLGIWGLMVAIALIYATSQMIDFGVLETVPEPLRHLWRAILAVSGPCMLYGFWVWWRDEREAVV